MSMWAIVGNIIWFFVCGLELGIQWVFAGLVCFCTIIGIPYGVACFRISLFAFFPFGQTLVDSENAGVCTFVLNVIWVVFAGIWLWLTAVLVGAVLCLTIIGIPFGLACFRLAKVCFAPLGKKVVQL